MKVRSLFSVLALVVALSVLGQEVGELVDPRDNKSYKIVTIDIELEGGVFIKRTWMAENLNYDVSPDFYAWVFPKYDHVAVGTGIWQIIYV